MSSLSSLNLWLNLRSLLQLLLRFWFTSWFLFALRVSLIILLASVENCVFWNFDKYLILLLCFTSSTPWYFRLLFLQLFFRTCLFLYLFWFWLRFRLGYWWTFLLVFGGLFLFNNLCFLLFFLRLSSLFLNCRMSLYYWFTYRPPFFRNRFLNWSFLRTFPFLLFFLFLIW